MKFYAMVNRGDFEPYKCFSFDRLKHLRDFCESYHWYRISYKEAKKYKDRKHVSVFGTGMDTYYRFD